MYWYYRKFPHCSVATEQYKMRGRNTIISYYHSKVDTKVVKVLCVVHWVPCVFIECVNQLDEDWLPNFDPSN